eukprot:2347954-Rhodomonas_salina.1
MNVGLDYVVLSVEEEGGGRRRKSHSAGGNARADLVMVPHGHSQHVRMLLMPEKQQELTHVMSEWKRRLIADSRRFGSNEFIGGFRVWADRDIDLPYLTAMEGIDGITSKDKEIITLLKKRVQDAAVDRYWNTIPGHNDILTFSENNHKANKKAAKSNSNAKFKLSIVYAVEKTVAQCIRGIAKKVESNTTDIDFRTQFSQVFPGLFWRGYKPNGLQQQPTPDACGQRFD